CFLSSSYTSPPSPYTLSLHDALPIFSRRVTDVAHDARAAHARALAGEDRAPERLEAVRADDFDRLAHFHAEHELGILRQRLCRLDRKSTRLNSSHVAISYAVFCLKKK